MGYGLGLIYHVYVCAYVFVFDLSVCNLTALRVDLVLAVVGHIGLPGADVCGRGRGNVGLNEDVPHLFRGTEIGHLQNCGLFEVQ